MRSAPEYKLHNIILHGMVVGFLGLTQVCAGHIVAIYLTLQGSSNHDNGNFREGTTTFSNVHSRIASWKENVCYMRMHNCNVSML
jgi:hypothetical protein